MVSAFCVAMLCVGGGVAVAADWSGLTGFAGLQAPSVLAKA